MLAEVGQVFLPKIDIEVFGIEFDAHQEQPGFFIAVLIGMKNVAAVAIDKVGDGSDFALAVRAGDEQDGGVFHRSAAVPAAVAAASRRRSESGTLSRQPARRQRYFFSVFTISRAAFAPDPPVKPAPGCVPFPHKYKFSIGVL